MWDEEYKDLLEELDAVNKQISDAGIDCASCHKDCYYWQCYNLVEYRNDVKSRIAEIESYEGFGC